MSPALETDSPAPGDVSGRYGPQGHRVAVRLRGAGSGSDVWATVFPTTAGSLLVEEVP
jgi:hypothetical protein